MHVHILESGVVDRLLRVELESDRTELRPADDGHAAVLAERRLEDFGYSALPVRQGTTGVDLIQEIAQDKVGMPRNMFGADRQNEARSS